MEPIGEIAMVYLLIVTLHSLPEQAAANRFDNGCHARKQAC
jgi:hypothetical protein